VKIIARSGKNKGIKTKKRKEVSTRSQDLWKYAYIAFCVILICLAAVPLYFGMSDPHSGWDYRVFLGAVQSVNHGQNPYIVANVNQYTGDNLPFTYPPHTLFFFWLLQFIFTFQNIWVYYAFLIAILIVSSYVLLTLDQDPHYLFFITLLFSGFICLFWNFITGNKDIIFFFLFSIIMYLLIKEKFWQSAVVMGLNASISLITIPFIAMYFVVKRSLADRLKYILISMGVLAAIFLGSFFLNPPFFISYLGTIGGSSSPLYDTAGYNTPTPFSMFGDLLNRANIGGLLPMIVVSLAYICIIGGAAWYCIRKNQENDLKIYSISLFSLFMILPRIKPYDFIILVVPLYFLFKDYSYRMKMLIFAAISLLPLFVWYYPWIDPLGVMPLPYIIDTYPQTVSLFLILAIMLIRERNSCVHSHES